ncbi:MAG TPA: hypothetical protein VFL60_00170 [Gaiellaceae bacterium]|nr:hypothetical protein [Gaiellaceae bacterium]
MKRLITTLVVALAVFIATAATALAADPVQSATQSSSTDQGAIAGSSATQTAPSNQNISVRILSEGDDGAVTQSNNAGSHANAANTASTTQSATQAAAAACGCSLPGGVQSTQQDASTGQLAGASSATQQTDPSNSNISVRVLSPGNNGSTTQSNNAASTADAANTGSTAQSGTQTGGGSGVQSSTQGADTTQGALAGSSTTQVDPSNSTLSIRVLSPGSDGNVSQTNSAYSGATATNTAPVTQTATQTAAPSSCGCGSSGLQAATQAATGGQGSLAGSSTQQADPANAADPAAVASSGGAGSTSQANDAGSHGDAANAAPTAQTATQSGGSGVQFAGQQSSVEQGSAALSSATQTGASNDASPVRIGSDGSGGSVHQSNDVHSSADATNSAPVSQTDSQSGSGIQAAGQESWVGQAAYSASSAFQHDPTNTADPVRIASDGSDGSVHQSNDVGSNAYASNDARPTQSATQTGAGGCGCSGPGIQALGQKSGVGQLAGAYSSAAQLGASNDASPVRVWSDGSGGSVYQSNDARSSADAANRAPVTQTASEQQGGGGVQAIGQESWIGQAAIAASSTAQLFGERSPCGCGGGSGGNVASPVRIGSDGSDGYVHQSNGAYSHADASNLGSVLQDGTQQDKGGCGCSGLGVQALGQSSSVDQFAKALSSAWQAGASNDASPVRVWSDGGGGSSFQWNGAGSDASAPNTARVVQHGRMLMA